MTKEAFDEIIDTANKMCMYEHQEDDIELCNVNCIGTNSQPKLHLFKGIDKAAALCESELLITPQAEDDNFTEWSFEYKGVHVFELVREGEEL